MDRSFYEMAWAWGVAASLRGCVPGWGNLVNLINQFFDETGLVFFRNFRDFCIGFACKSGQFGGGVGSSGAMAGEAGRQGP